jgi:hypothetical protein
MRVIHPVLVTVLLAACGGDGSNHGTVDAPTLHQDAAIDSKVSDAPADAPVARESQVAVVEGASTHGDHAQISVTVADGSVYGSVLGSDGPCTHYAGDSDGINYSAGTVTVTGTTVGYTVTPSGSPPDVYYTTSPMESLPLFASGATISISATGSSDFPAFSGTVTAPAQIAGFTAPSTVSRAGYAAHWTAAASGPKIWLVLVGIHGSQSSVLVCRVDDTGSFTVPSSSFALFPTVYDQVDVAIARVSETLLTSPAVSLVGATEQVTNPVALTQ